MKTAGATPNIGEGIYTAADASRILNIPYSKTNYWFKYYLKEKHFKTDYRYYFHVKDILAVNFLTLIEMYVFYAFKEEKVKISTIVEAHETISKLYKTPYPFASEDFWVSGKNIFFGNEAELISATKGQQRVFSDILIPFSKKITYSNDRLAHKYYPLGRERTIVINPENQFGQPIIEGTNILAATIYNHSKGGDSNKFIAELFNISIRNVQDAIAYAQAA